MPGSAALAAFALQLLTAFEGPALGATEPVRPEAGPQAARSRPGATGRSPGWLVVRRQDAAQAAGLAALEGSRPQ